MSSGHRPEEPESRHLDIYAEIAVGAIDLKEPEIKWFARQGVPAHYLAQTYCREFSAIELSAVAFLSGGTFEFAHDLRGPSEVVLAYVMPLRNVNGNAADVFAWHPQTRRFALWRNAVATLGEEQIDMPRLEHLPVHQDVISWLRTGRRGLVIVDQDRAAPLLQGRGPLLVSSVAHGNLLRKQLTIAAPEILVTVAAPEILVTTVAPSVVGPQAERGAE
jgi:hypothetical protein